MVTPRKNPTIGKIDCWTPGCDLAAAVRRDGRGRLYMVCLDCGQYTPPGEKAQNAMLDQAQVWGEQGEAPPGTPRWIAEDWPHQRTVRDAAGALEPLGHPGGDPTDSPGDELEVASGDPPGQPSGASQGEAPRAPQGPAPVPPPPEHKGAEGQDHGHQFDELADPPPATAEDPGQDPAATDDDSDPDDDWP